MAGAIKRQDINGGARHKLDKFYTNPKIASQLVETIEELIQESDVVVEPSAGSGVFVDCVEAKKLLAYDLRPEHPQVEQKDWFSVSRSDIGEGVLTIIGNPPFGVRADLAKKFIQHAVKLDAETIAFILPSTFSKTLNQKETLFPQQYRLVIEKILPDESFLLDGKRFHIPCGWYVWTKNKNFHKEVNLRKKALNKHPDFLFLPRGDKNADFTVNGNNGKVKSLAEVSNLKSEHYIKVNDRSKVEEVKERFARLTYVFYSSVNGGVAWIGRQEIIEAYSSEVASELSCPSASDSL